jgi:hypothetical protein
MFMKYGAYDPLRASRKSLSGSDIVRMVSNVRLDRAVGHKKFVAIIIAATGFIFLTGMVH